jgi:hypothetical protein
MRLARITWTEVYCWRFCQVSWDAHIGVCSYSPELKRVRRFPASISQRLNDCVIWRHLGTVSIQDPFDPRGMLG